MCDPALACPVLPPSVFVRLNNPCVCPFRFCICPADQALCFRRTNPVFDLTDSVFVLLTNPVSVQRTNPESVFRNNSALAQLTNPVFVQHINPVSALTDSVFFLSGTPILICPAHQPCIRPHQLCICPAYQAGPGLGGAQVELGVELLEPPPPLWSMRIPPTLRSPRVRAAQVARVGSPAKVRPHLRHLTVEALAEATTEGKRAAAVREHARVTIDALREARARLALQDGRCAAACEQRAAWRKASQARGASDNRVRVLSPALQHSAASHCQPTETGGAACYAAPACCGTLPANLPAATPSFLTGAATASFLMSAVTSSFLIIAATPCLLFFLRRRTNSLSDGSAEAEQLAAAERRARASAAEADSVLRDAQTRVLDTVQASPAAGRTAVMYCMTGQRAFRFTQSVLALACPAAPWGYTKAA
eukprot:365313-Chlamydomonas_euryale.AAC.38